MKKYDWVIFDLDETLLRFDSYRALETLFSNLNLTFTENHFTAYEEKNKSLWAAYQNGHITLDQLQHDRFVTLSRLSDIPPMELNNAFLLAVETISTPLDGAINLLNTLKNKTRLGVITNGFTDMQHRRIEKGGMKNHFDFILTSEAVGIPKPNPLIFNHALQLMDNPIPENVLMIGDSFEADIMGGINAGMHTCWLNPKNKPLPENAKPHFQVASLPSLEKLIQTVLTE